MKSLISSIRIAIVTQLVCVGAYTALILGLAKIASPGSAEGSLIHHADGQVIGSRLVAQQFTYPRYFWPRPSAVDYNAAGAGGSNKSPTSPDLAERGKELVALYGATAENPLPAELATASGAGLDPHITARAARYQAPRVAEARGVEQVEVEALIERQTFSPGGSLSSDKLVNVLELNLALDGLK